MDALAKEEITAETCDAVGLLALVAGQDVEPAEGSDGTDGRWKIAHRVAEDRVISTVDPEARHTRKSPEAAGTATARTWSPNPAPGWSPMRN